MRLRTASTKWNVLGKYGPHEKLFFFLVKKEPLPISHDVPCKPFVSAETLKACVLLGLHLLAAEGEVGSSGSQASDLGDMWRQGCPKMFGMDQLLALDRRVRPPLGVRCISITTSAWLLESPGRLVKRGGDALSQGLGAWKGSFVVQHDHGSYLPRNEGCVLGELRVAGFPWFNMFAVSGRFSSGRVRELGAWKVNCHSKQTPFSHRGRAVTITERDVERKIKRKRRRVS